MKMFTKLDCESMLVYNTKLQTFKPMIYEINPEHVQKHLRKPARPKILKM